MPVEIRELVIKASPVSVIVTGATGMVGEAVLQECLQSPIVEKVLVVSRKPCGIRHPKLSEIIHADFFDLTPIENSLSGYNACFFCLGVSSVGMKKPDYEKMTYVLTMGFARTVQRLNNNMQFCYVSGSGTDSTEKGKLHWARVKGKTENDLQKLGFAKVWLCRPGIMKSGPGLTRAPKLYHWFSWLIPIIEFISPKSVIKLTDVGDAMIQVVTKGYPSSILEVKDILSLTHEA